MGFVGIPDKFGDDPRIIAIGDAAAMALIRCYCYANMHETDGFLPAPIVMRFMDLKTVGTLLQQGLLEPRASDFSIVGFLDHNLTHENREAARDKAKAGAKKRWENAGRDRPSSARSNAPSIATGIATSSARSNAQGQGQRPIQRQEPEEEVPPPSPPSAQPRQTTIDPDPAPELRPTSAEAALVATPRSELVPSKKSAMTLKAVGGTGNDLISDCLKWIAEKPPRNGQERVWQFYVFRYCIAHGSKPTDKGYYHSNLESLLSNHAPEVVIGKINSYFDRPTWPYEKGARDLDRFVKYFDQIPATKDAAIVRQIGFERASAEFLGRVNGHADLIPPEILDLMRGPRKDTPF